MELASRPVCSAEPLALRARPWPDHALLDSGGGRKLERYGDLIVVRPEGQCLWPPRHRPARWDAADAVFEPADEEEAGQWRFSRPLPESWSLSWGAVNFLARFTAFRHLAVFPEQAANWDWLSARPELDGRPLRVLNLFGYTGVASLVAAARGAHVTHVDASKKAMVWAKENAQASGLADSPIRWICEDARKWVAREVRRGARYDAIILDPPKYGRGPAGEVWRLYEDLPDLLRGCNSLLSDQAAFLLLNAYSERLTGLALSGLLADSLAGRQGQVEWGELTLMEEAGERGAGLSFFARWTAR
jgi:23S rRNA (cytosine1962-C5)-methyltransferase